ncbi:hypothetical protein BKA93DRAFT_781653 [Sparassis latifolia]
MLRISQVFYVSIIPMYFLFSSHDPHIPRRQTPQTHRRLVHAQSRSDHPYLLLPVLHFTLFSVPPSFSCSTKFNPSPDFTPTACVSGPKCHVYSLRALSRMCALIYPLSMPSPCPPPCARAFEFEPFVIPGRDPLEPFAVQVLNASLDVMMAALPFR